MKKVVLNDLRLQRQYKFKNNEKFGKINKNIKLKKFKKIKKYKDS